MHIILEIAKNRVAGFLPDPRYTPLGTFETFNITILNISINIFL